MLLHLGLILTFAANPPMQHSIDQTITFKCPATRAENLMPLLAQKTGLHLKVGRKMADEVLIIDVKGVKVKDLMDRVAFAASARWSKQDGSYKLERPAIFEESLIRNERKERSQAIKKAIGIDPVDDMKADESAAANLEALSQMLSSSGLNSATVSQFLSPLTSQRRGNSPSLLPALLQCLDTDQLAAMPKNSRLVYCSKPNGKQLTLPLTTFTHNAIAGLLSVLNRTVATSPEEAGNAQKGSSLYEKALLTVKRGEEDDFYFIDLVLAAQDGTTEDIDTCRIQLNIKPRATLDIRFPIDIAWSPVTQTINPRMNRSYSARNPLSKPLKRQILNPERYDPLATNPSDILFSIAKSERCDLVGCLPDELEGSITMSQELGGKLKDAAQFADTCPGITTSKAGNWLLVKPSFPVDATAERMDRRTLGQYLRNYNPDKPMQLTTLIELIGGLDKTKSDTINSYLQTIDRMLCWPNLPTDWYDAEPLRFLNLIGAEQLKPLLNGQIVHLGELNPKALAYLDQVVYRQEGQLYLNSHDNKQLDASEVLPDGLPRSGTIRIKHRTGKLFVERADWDERYFDSDKLAEQCLRFWSKNPFYVGRFHIYTLQLDLTPDVEGSYTLEYVAPDRTRPYQLDNLPAAYRKELQQAMERRRRSTE